MFCGCSVHWLGADCVQIKLNTLEIIHKVMRCHSILVGFAYFVMACVLWVALFYLSLGDHFLVPAFCELYKIGVAIILVAGAGTC